MRGLIHRRRRTSPGHTPTRGRARPASPPRPSRRRLRLDPAATALTRPRRSRARARKPAKPAAEPPSDSAPATWIRVGPGKYVRSTHKAEGSGLEADSEVPPTAEAPPPVEGQPPLDVQLPSESQPAVQVHAVASDIDPSPGQPEPATEPEVVPDVSPAAEEYGIAPSAFGPVLSVVRGPWSVVELSVRPSGDPPSSSGSAHRSRSRRPRHPATDKGRRKTDSRMTASGRRMWLFARGWRGRSPYRTRDNGQRTTNHGRRRADAARRASARTPHVRRDWRARSPPAC